MLPGCALPLRMKGASVAMPLPGATTSTVGAEVRTHTGLNERSDDLRLAGAT